MMNTSFCGCVITLLLFIAAIGFPGSSIFELQGGCTDEMFAVNIVTVVARYYAGYPMVFCHVICQFTSSHVA